ncbi:tRNA uridine-5-carboxymethylaminomethyl(34) synthesis GTPase MnmE [Hydrogenivirga sp. 128-5-R1-1]|uniref:tRNA uridine-5-carboxymethylaminomethyl(34) synthesis GTPase MnmE n=1 Tax=Hydrogenivirga sp. 128-5-R1-1 TaxID=392423 RepID=UPI00015EF9D4|nr:tRNA uridine-5-carboxymethylaminomethyl(34) synthesis GTPase MnmE [Hydrogenivirga sp. 128-5-R1-1]EDP75273.1 tRNA modification GTPase TrmE [Hydrogenivirga sp. 128-5-R1-1]
MKDPIVAIATPFGESAIGVVRLTGKDVLPTVLRYFRTKSEVKPRYAHYGTLVDERGEPIDEGILVYYRAPNSYTGEDMVELSLHGNPLILKRVLELFLSAGCRLAEPGEFTRRAFLNGKLDLAQAEAVAELISAKTELARRASLRQLRGELSRYVNSLRESLLELSAYIEADIEFSEEDIPTLTKEQVIGMVDRVLEGIDQLLSTAKTGKLLREGIKLAIVGRPNVGKSSLFNALLKEDRAIVTDIEGTTRDYIEESLNLRGIPVRLIDTAGIRESEDPVERIGVERSMEKIEEADVVLFVVDASEELREEDSLIYEKLGDKDIVVVFNKIDRGEVVPLEKFQGHSIIKVSALKGYGLKDLEEEILKKAGAVAHEGLNIYVSVRHEELLKKARETLSKFRDRYAKEDISPEIAMLDVREASDFLGEIVGHITTEEVLGSIFSRFCIGK